MDFLVTRDHRPWFMVEVKSAMSQALSPQLGWFQRKLGVPHAFQVAVDTPFIDADCFAIERPVKVPALGFLSQLP